MARRVQWRESMHEVLMPVVTAFSLLVASSVHARTPPAPTTPNTLASQPAPTFGVGYKLGNGVGFAGIDLIASPIPHFSVELQAAALLQFDSGYAVLPSVVGSLKATGSTPYVKVGYMYLSVADDFAGTSVTASGSGGFANIGYEWKYDSGLAIQLGGGVNYIQEITVMSDETVSSLGGEAYFNLELGLRYRF